MTKISSKTAYPKKKPISSDYFVGTDSEDFNKTVNFGFEEVAGLVNKLNGTPLLNYVFSTSPYLSTEVLLEGRFLSDENELSTPSLTKLYINKFNNSGDNLQELYLFLQTNATDFYLKLRNSNNQNNAVYFDIASIEDFTDYFILNITVFKENEFFPLLENLNVYFFDFELKATSAGTSDPLKLDKGGYEGTAQDLNNLIKNISFPDQVLKIGEIVITGLNAFVSAGDFQWRLNQVDFLTAPEFSEYIDPATDGFNRTDILEGDNAGIIHLKKGVESESASPEPSVTAGRIRLAGIPVFGSTIGTPSLPIVGDNYISKREKSAFQVYQSGEINNTVLDDFFYGYLNFRDAVTNLKSIGTYTNAHLYSGRELLIKNSQATDITIYHLTGSGFQFSFPNEVNFILKPNEIIRFSTKILSPTSGILEYVGVVLTKADIGLSNVENTSDLNKPVSTAQQAALDSKLDASAYNEYFKGKYTSSGALTTANPTATDGDYAIVDAGTGVDAKEWIWDNEAGWIVGGATGASTTDALPEGSINLYHTSARVLDILLTGISFVTGTAVTAADSVLVAFGKLQKQIADFNTTANIKSLLGITTLSGSNTGDQDLSNLKNKTYSNVAHFGNSLCTHAIDANWWGTWGMAATIRENDYVHKFWDMLKVKNPGATSTALSIYQWELDYTTFDKTTMDSYLVGRDLVVLRLGENVTYYADFQNQYKILVQYIQSKVPNATIILGGQFWTNATKETAMQNVAVELGLPFVSVKHLDSATYKQTMGAMVYGDDLAWHAIANSGVAIHPNDLGMLEIAKSLFSAIDFPFEIDKTTPQKEIIGNVTLDNSYNGCIVKIKATANITVPATLKPYFNCVFDSWTGFTGTFIQGSGATISSDGLKLLPEKMATLYKDGAAPVYRLKGETSV